MSLSVLRTEESTGPVDFTVNASTIAALKAPSLPNGPISSHKIYVNAASGPEGRDLLRDERHRLRLDERCVGAVFHQHGW